MSTTTPQILIWENPSSLFNVTVPINITWSLSTFNAINLGNFELNMWLLRHDNVGVTVLKSYPPILVAGQHKAHDRGILFTPSIDDLDIGIVQEGNHQLTWEFYDNNTALNPTACCKGKAFSKGFQFRAQPVISSSTSSIISSTYSTISSSQTSSPTTIASSSISATTTGTTTTGNPPNANSATTAPTAVVTAATVTPSSTNQGVIIGLSVGFGILLGAALIGLLFWFLHRRNRKKAVELADARKDSEGSSMQDLRPKNSGWDGGGGNGGYTNGGIGGNRMDERGSGMIGNGGTYPTGKSYHRYEPGEIVEAGSGKRDGPVELA